ncbi:SusC/RagA family TonB-linked outer membrane protein [Marinilabilia rubra]|uniref:TonB-dependent receptor n=1 Tax=Marinilabilia rubra TaxID=2162893 RepID=A0A2U2BDE9_9BACT|nr:TonB-dependent receptor [Marinilabilia rubra]PWE01088.1 TonB-dependent receptor [Marinilabilia rubra]
MRRIIFSLLLTFLVGHLASAQDINVSGVVKDLEGEPIPGANVFVKSQPTSGTITDMDGHYEISLEQNQTLVFTFIGMKTVEINVENQREINVVLEEQLVNLDEVVAVGYGVQKKSDITGSVASVDFSELEDQPIASVDQALQGRVAGVQIVSNSGAPGGSLAVRVRGIGTINNADPLYVVDGIPVSDIDFLNANDIESIEILKDASASAIYGSRGANGVVLITSKKGGLNEEARVNFNAYYGTQQVINNWETTSGSEWYGIQEELNNTRTSALDLSIVDPNQNTDWFDELTRVAPIYDVNLNVAGGSEKLTYSLSVGGFGQEGTIKGSEFQRRTLKLNSDYHVSDKFTIGSNINIQTSEQESILEGSYHTGVINTAIKLEPVVPVWNNKETGEYGYSAFTDYPNPVAQIAYENARNEKLNLLGNIYAEYEFISGLSFKTTYNQNSYRNDSYDFEPVYYVNVNQQNVENEVSQGYNKGDYWTWENVLTFNKSFNRHELGVMAGYTMEEGTYEWTSASKKNIPNEDEALWYFNAAADGDYVSGNASEVGLMSYLGRLNYSFDNKYLVTVNFRADGSSRFPEGNKWGYFPSLALGWKMSEEAFMSNIDWISSLKLRAGWGQIGNNNIGYYPYQTTMSGNAQYRYLFGPEENFDQGYVVVNMRDQDIKWETVESYNLGLDALLFDGRLQSTIDWYLKDTEDMLVGVPIPMYYGYEGGPVSNVGSVRNTGLELSLNYKERVNADLRYNVGFNISTYNNEVLSLGNGQPITGGSYYGGSATRTEEGQPIGYFYGYKTDGVFQTQAEIDNHAAQVGADNAGLEPGDLKFVDTNEDGLINDDDRTFLGSPIPDFTYGLNGGLNYKGVEFSLFFQGSQGNEIFNAMKTHLYKFDETNKHKDMLNSWTPQNTNTDMPRLDGNDINNTNRTSDRFVEDGSYIRLKNLTVGYNIPEKFLSPVGVKALKVYFSGQNLWTKTDYSGADPEIGQRSSTNYLSRGVDIGTYPQAQVYTFGVKMQF